MPDAVGPTTATTGRSIASFCQRGVPPRISAVTSIAALFLGVTMTYADDLASEEDELETDDEFDEDADEFDLDDEFDSRQIACWARHACRAWSPAR